MTMQVQVARWFDAHRPAASTDVVDWARIVPFIGLHVALLAVFWVGVSPAALVVAVASYVLRMFAITAFYHRYFAHKAFRTGRLTQFLFALLGAAATQRGPLWWSGHHRRHHRGADTPLDPHDSGRGFVWSHLGWFLSGRNHAVPAEAVPDWTRYRELVWLDRFHIVVPVAYAFALYALGGWLERGGVDTSGPQMLVWGYCVATVALIHVTLFVNSLGHRVGTRRFDTPDASRNCAWLALLTLGEGWHNNHHRYAGSARQGFYWWELDLTWLGLRLLAALGLVHDLKPVPAAVLAEGRRQVRRRGGSTAA
jgi:stearoyl-CoA desaturase (delta-9 desaturase)